MRTTERCTLAALLGLLLTGCAFTTQVTVGGVEFEFETSSVSIVGSRPGELHIRSGGARMDLVDGQLTVNGVPRGPVGPGDRVRVYDSGRVLVNGRVRPGA